MSSTSCETSIQHGTFEGSASICNFIGANEKQVTHLSGHMGLALSLWKYICNSLFGISINLIGLQQCVSDEGATVLYGPTVCC